MKLLIRNGRVIDPESKLDAVRNAQASSRSVSSGG